MRYSKKASIRVKKVIWPWFGCIEKGEINESGIIVDGSILREIKVCSFVIRNGSIEIQPSLERTKISRRIRTKRSWFKESISWGNELTLLKINWSCSKSRNSI